MNRQHAHRPEDLSRWPRITADHVIQLLGLIAVVLIFIAITAVAAEPPAR